MCSKSSRLSSQNHRVMEKVRREKPAKPSRPTLIVNCSPICPRSPSVKFYFKTVQRSHYFFFFHHSKSSFDDLNSRMFVFLRLVASRSPAVYHLFFSVACAGKFFMKLFKIMPKLGNFSNILS